jgi:hypothetical protein
MIEYIRTGRKICAALTPANRYAQGFLLSRTLLPILAFVSTPIRFIIWALAIAIDISHNE